MLLSMAGLTSHCLLAFTTHLERETVSDGPNKTLVASTISLSPSYTYSLSLSPFLGKWREWGKVWLSARARIVARLNAIWDRAFGWVPVEGVLVAAVAAAVVVVAVAILLSFSHQWTELYTHTVSVIIYSNVVFERVRMSTTTKRDRCFQLSWSSLVC